MLNEKVQTSKFLSQILRHKPEKIGIQLDENGWTDVETLIQQANQHGVALTLETLRDVVAHNNKSRFAFDKTGTKIRASQGHSIDIDLAYEPKSPPVTLYHGTYEAALESILESGLDKRKRHHVHLSKDLETARIVGGRRGKAVVLKVLARQMEAKGHVFYQSENGVWLVDSVPVAFLVQI